MVKGRRKGRRREGTGQIQRERRKGRVLRKEDEGEVQVSYCRIVRCIVIVNRI